MGNGNVQTTRVFEDEQQQGGQLLVDELRAREGLAAREPELRPLRAHRVLELLHERGHGGRLEAIDCQHVRARQSVRRHLARAVRGHVQHQRLDEVHEHCLRYNER